jgi:ATP-dependent helicase HepA
MEEFITGQRWISETEPELGLGKVLSSDNRFVEILFPGSSNTRKYSIKNAPLRRVLFKSGDQVKSNSGSVFTVESVQNDAGLITYNGGGQALSETDLSDSISFTTPQDRLFTGQTDENYVFNLRYETLLHRSEALRSDTRGFTGARVELIPHQLYIVHEVTGRYSPRVLLADEVGLGKTIEAGLIIHQMLLSERVSRVLIITPESLVNQWFIEMLRRFNLSFNILNEEICKEMAENEPEINPFGEYQLVLCDLQFLTASPLRQAQIAETAWDLMVVDEAHHLEWTAKKASMEYQVIDLLAALSKSLLLLTATPEQLGLSSHFARLRLLDPDRFYDLDQFIEETRHYQEIAGLADHILKEKKLAEKDIKILRQVLGKSKNLEKQLEEVNKGNREEAGKIIEALVDQHGTGRVLFRNTRAVMPFFPPRKALPVCLEQKGPVNLQHWWKSDPRIEWLVRLLDQLKGEKVLLICASKKLALDIDEALRDKSVAKTAVFHEDLTLIGRDRNAAYFAEKEGADILICSEIGSEGRNFQFSHHLVLFDLPGNPDLLEQRIGRLDRIGQKAEIQIHIPYIKNSGQEIFYELYQHGLDAFEHSPHGAVSVFNHFRERITAALEDPKSAAGKEGKVLKDLTREIKEYYKQVLEALEKGRDRLLELNSFRPEVGSRIAARIKETDSDKTLEEYMDRIFEHFGIESDDISERSYFISPSDLMFTEAFPGLPYDGVRISYDRKEALEREEIQFLTWEHPMVTGAMDLLLSSEHGNSSLVMLESLKEPGLILEAVYILECIAPDELQADRFLPPTPVRVMVNHSLQEENIDFEMIKKEMVKINPDKILSKPEISQAFLKLLLEKTEAKAEDKIAGIIKVSLENMVATLSYETRRLLALKEVNPTVTDEEIEFARERIALLHESISSARLRLDSLRLICSDPEHW